MDFSQVRYFLALADTLNFTRAAERCHVTQPTLTQAIKRLEEELGAPLVIRDGRDTRLSELGKGLRGHFERIAETRATLRETARAITAGEMTELNIGLMCTVGPRVLAQILERFQTENPNAAFYLHDVPPDRIADMLLSGALDGCFCATHGERHTKLDYTPLFKEKMVVAFPETHHFTDAESVTLAAVSQERYLDRLHCEFRDELNAFTTSRGTQVDVVFTSEREDWIQNLIRDGAGVSVIPEFSLIPPALEHRPIIEPTLEREVEFATVYGGPKSASLRSLGSLLQRFDWRSHVDSVASK